MIEDRIIDMFAAIGIDIDPNMIRKPKNEEHGDVSCSVAFTLAKKQKRNPNEIAQNLATKLEQKGLDKIFSRVEVKGPFLNFFFSKKELAMHLFKIIEIEKENWAQTTYEDEGVSHLIEYYQPNTHKGVHIGHLRNGALGESVSRVLKYIGSSVDQVFYIGDIGSHVAKWIWFYTNFPEEVKSIQEKEPKNWIGEVYAQATRSSDSDKAQAEIRAVHRKLESGDEELLSVWEKTRTDSLKDIMDIANELDLHFEKVYYESEVQDRGKNIVDELVEQDIAKIDDGAPIVDFESRNINLTNFLLMKSDGSSLYATKDLALAYEKLEEFDFDVSLFVIATAQNLYLKQLFKTLELMNYPKENIHLGYELVTLPSGKMSSRYGTVVLYRDLYEKMNNIIVEEIKKRNPEIIENQLQKTAKKIVVGAMKFSMLNTSINRKIKFDYEEALSFEGKTATYIQYTGLRATKILEKAAERSIALDIEAVDPSYLSKIDFTLLKKIYELPEQIQTAATRLDPVNLTEYAFEVSKLFNLFYDQRSVLHQDDSNLQSTLLFIVHSFQVTIQCVLSLLGIEIPSVM